MNRPSDAALAVARVMNELTLHVNSRNYPRRPTGLSGNFDATMIVNALLVSTVDDHGMTASELAKQLRLPRSTVLGHLSRLVEDGLVIKARTIFQVDLSKLDALVTDEGVARCIEIVARGLRELRSYQERRHPAERRPAAE